ncbi:MAG: hypothetical protein KGM16_16465 [Bacteroidota bacterium]|nr:hypothetical protein [Bacteroidota bacterium]
MKKFITILFFAGFLTTASYAQSGHRQQKIINLTVRVTRQAKIPETIVINIPKTPVMTMVVTGIMSRITAIMKMIIGITTTGITVIDIGGKEEMVTNVTITEGMKIIAIETIAGAGNSNRN